jgi:hypothetical protein
VDELVQRAPRRRLEHEAEVHEVQVRVRVHRARRVCERLRDHGPPTLGARRVVGIQRRGGVRPKAGRVREELLHGDRALVVRREGGEVRRDGRIEREHALR